MTKCLVGLSVLLLLGVTNAAVTPYTNLAAGQRVYASATCGTYGSELFCKIGGNDVGWNVFGSNAVQQCDTCDANSEYKRYPAENAVDGTESWWQSPLVSNNYVNEVNFTVDLEKV